jgi:arabinofuranosyltransferase
VRDQAETRRALRAAQLLLLLTFTLLVLRNAWMMDDAYITLRTVDNVFAGHGPVWNPGERVQSYTHPLWMLMFCAIYAVTREYLYTMLITGALVSTAALAIVTLRLARSQWLAIALLLAAMLSHAFVDWSTSGLENPLTHLLIGLFAWVYLGQPPNQRRFQLLCLIGGLSLLSRPDNAMLLGPAVIAAGVQAWRHGTKPRALLRAVLVGGIPLYTWELFSLFYYGSLVPNTALAKLNTGIDSAELIEQGFFYFVATLDMDPLTLVVVFAGMMMPILAKKWRLLPLALGIAVHLIYTIKIGGDFMLGRFFTAPMFMAMVCLSQIRRPSLLPLGVVSAVLVILGLATNPNTFEINSKSSDNPNTARTRRGVTDERTLLFDTGLVKSSRIHETPTAFWWDRQNPKSSVEAKIVLGYRGLVGGPDVHWIDITALSDPLLARLPAKHRPDWMMGHFMRAIPEGYRETLETGENVIKDPGVAELYRQLDLVVHGDLWSLERLQAIWWLNTGGPDRVVNAETWRYTGAIKIQASKLAWRVADGVRLDGRKLVYEFGQAGVYVKFAERQHPNVLELSVSGQDRYEIVFYDGREEVARVDVPYRLVYRTNGVVARRIELPEHLSERGFLRLRILPETKSQAKRPLYLIGHLLFDEAIETAPPVTERPLDAKEKAAKEKAAKEKAAKEKAAKETPARGKPRQPKLPAKPLEPPMPELDEELLEQVDSQPDDSETGG